MLRLPVAELEENLEDAEKRREEFAAAGGIFGKGAEGEGEEAEEEEEVEE